MKNLILITVALVSFAFQAQAVSQCVPSKTVAEAKYDYDKGLEYIGTQLNAEYNKAALNLQRDQAAIAQVLQQRLQAINLQHEQEVAKIQDDLNPGWREALVDATERHNAAVQEAKSDYELENNISVMIYNKATEQSRLNYERQAAKLAAEYNRAVCATP